jgi:hypothetical protein
MVLREPGEQPYGVTDVPNPILTKSTSTIRRLPSAALHHINHGLRSTRASVEV